MRIALVTLILLTLSGCRYDNFSEPSPASPTDMPQANVTVEQLRALVGKGEITVSQVVELAVTSSDSAGNFYKEFYGEDASGGMRFKLGIYDIFGLLVRGAVIRVELSGLAVGIEAGCLVAGVANGADIVALGPEALIRQHFRTTGERRVSPWPLVAGDLNSQYVGRYVEIGGTFATGFWSENAIFTDDYGGGIYVYTSKYATFYGQSLPTGRVKLRGIVVRNGGRLELRLSDLSEVSKAPFQKKS